MASRILIAGIGNIFLGDDGFGSEVMRHVCGQIKGSHGVRATDYGIGGMHLAYDLLEDWDALVLVDAIPSRGSPGTVHVFEADHGSPDSPAGLDAHGMDPATVFASLRALGGTPPRTIVVGCEVADVGDLAAHHDGPRGGAAQGAKAGEHRHGIHAVCVQTRGRIR